MKGTSLETIESQTQHEYLHTNLENYAESRRTEAAPVGKKGRAMLEAVGGAAVAQTATQSLLALQDEDTTDTPVAGDPNERRFRD